MLQYLDMNNYYFIQRLIQNFVLVIKHFIKQFIIFAKFRPSQILFITTVNRYFVLISTVTIFCDGRHCCEMLISKTFLVLDMVTTS